MRLSFAVVLALTSGCYLAHEAESRRRDAGADSFIDGSPGADECTDPALDGAILTPEEATWILGRLHHEVEHAVTRGLRVVRGEVDEGERVVIDDALTEDGGEALYTGALDGEASGHVEMRFTRWSGRHGGFGPSALEGRACMTFRFVDLTPENERVEIQVSAAVGLAGGGAFTPAPAANVRYSASWQVGARGDPSARLEGTVGSHDIASLRER